MSRRIQIILAVVLLAVILFCMIFVPEIKKSIEDAEHERRTAETVLHVAAMPAYIREAVMAYNDLIDPADITYEMLDAVTSLRIMYDQCVDVSVNCELYGTNLGPYVKPNRMEQLYLANISKGTALNHTKAFFQLADLNNPILDSAAVSRLKKYYPEVEDGPFYILDPFCSRRELSETFAILEEYVFTNGELVYDRTLDLSSLTVFENLEYVEYYVDLDDVELYDSREAYAAEMGLTFENCPVEIRTVEGIFSHWSRLRTEYDAGTEDTP